MNQEPFGHYWEVVHKATGAVVNAGFERYEIGDQMLPEEIPYKMDGFVIRNTYLFTKSTPAAEAA